MSSQKISTLEANPLGHITGSLAISQRNLEAMLNALIEWEQSKLDKVTVRLSTNTPPYYVDYVFATRHSSISTGGENMAAPFLMSKHFAYNEMHRVAASYEPEHPDTVVLRVTAGSDFGKQAKLYAVPAIYDECTVLDPDTGAVSYRVADTYSKDYPDNTYIARCRPDTVDPDFPVACEVVRTNRPVTAGETLVSGFDVSSNCYPVVIDYPGSSPLPRDDIMVRYEGNVYILTGDRNMSYVPSKAMSGFEKLCSVFTPGTTYSYGDMVECNGMLYVYKFGADSVVAPQELVADAGQTYLVENSAYWDRFCPIDMDFYVGNGGTFRYVINTDIVGFVVRNMMPESFPADASIRVRSSVRIPGWQTAQPKGVDIIPSSNFTCYPVSGAAKWVDGASYGPTDTAIGVYGLQEYTAAMIFNHANADVARVNFICYDGPDLDQGLAIFLPVNVLGEHGEVVTPKDGMVFDFVLRIWPNPALNGGKVNDLIVNKSQVYVYNVTDYADLDLASRSFDRNNVWPIAKFSMARLTNFYVFGENVAIPDRPVVYRASFVYSATRNRWELFDYYMFPDHIFMSPNGFTDAAETAGFPMFQDPFSNSDLSPVRIGEEYFGRMRNHLDGP